MNKRQHNDLDREESEFNAKKVKSDRYIFHFKDRYRFDRKFPFFRKPSEIGCFSINLKEEYVNDKSQLRFYIPPKGPDKVSFDLRKGYGSMKQKDETKKSDIDSVLKWILLNKSKFQIQKTPENENRTLNTDFICWRGLLTKLLCSPYENREGWLIAVTLYNGTYYLCEFDTEEKKRMTENRSERDKEMCCWGWKFEQYLTSEKPDSMPDTESDYNNIEAFCTIVRSRLQDHSLVFAGEVDALKTGADSSSQYVELKTSREISHPRQNINFKRFKLIKWWAQSFLVGIPEIICGYRDDEGIVHTLKSFNTMSLPEYCKDIHNPWRPNVCFNFLNEFLGFLKSVIKLDDPREVHLLHWSPNDDISCRKLPRDSDFTFLPDWYINPETQ